MNNGVKQRSTRRGGKRTYPPAFVMKIERKGRYVVKAYVGSPSLETDRGGHVFVVQTASLNSRKCEMPGFVSRLWHGAP